jgi:antitoxin VapB
MQRVKVIHGAKDQTIRLPEAVALPATVKQVDVAVLGRARLITPSGQSWDRWFASPRVTSDFMESRDQPSAAC